MGENLVQGLVLAIVNTSPGRQVLETVVAPHLAPTASARQTVARANMPGDGVPAGAVFGNFLFHIAHHGFLHLDVGGAQAPPCSSSQRLSHQGCDRPRGRYHAVHLLQLLLHHCIGGDAAVDGNGRRGNRA